MTNRLLINRSSKVISRRSGSFFWSIFPLLPVVIGRDVHGQRTGSYEGFVLHATIKPACMERGSGCISGIDLHIVECNVGSLNVSLFPGDSASILVSISVLISGVAWSCNVLSCKT